MLFHVQLSLFPLLVQRVSLSKNARAGAGMAMQVTVSKTDAQARAGGVLVLAPRAGDVFSCAIPMTDLQTTPTRALLLTQQRAGSVMAATSRCAHKTLRLMFICVPKLHMCELEAWKLDAGNINGFIDWGGCHVMEWALHWEWVHIIYVQLGLLLYHQFTLVPVFELQCPSRYFFQLKYLAELLTGPNTFHIKVEAQVQAVQVIIISHTVKLLQASGTGTSALLWGCSMLPVKCHTLSVLTQQCTPPLSFLNTACTITCGVPQAPCAYITSSMCPITKHPPQHIRLIHVPLDVRNLNTQHMNT